MIEGFFISLCCCFVIALIFQVKQYFDVRKTNTAKAKKGKQRKDSEIEKTDVHRYEITLGVTILGLINLVFAYFCDNEIDTNKSNDLVSIYAILFHVFNSLTVTLLLYIYWNFVKMNSIAFYRVKHESQAVLPQTFIKIWKYIIIIIVSAYYVCTILSFILSNIVVWFIFWMFIFNFFLLFSQSCMIYCIYRLRSPLVVGMSKFNGRGSIIESINSNSIGYGNEITTRASLTPVSSVSQTASDEMNGASNGNGAAGGSSNSIINVTSSQKRRAIRRNQREKFKSYVVTLHKLRRFNALWIIVFITIVCIVVEFILCISDENVTDWYFNNDYNFAAQNPFGIDYLFLSYFIVLFSMIIEYMIHIWHDGRVNYSKLIKQQKEDEEQAKALKHNNHNHNHNHSHSHSHKKENTAKNETSPADTGKEQSSGANETTQLVNDQARTNALDEIRIAMSNVTNSTPVIKEDAESVAYVTLKDTNNNKRTNLANILKTTEDGDNGNGNGNNNNDNHVAAGGASLRGANTMRSMTGTVGTYATATTTHGLAFQTPTTTIRGVLSEAENEIDSFYGVILSETMRAEKVNHAKELNYGAKNIVDMTLDAINEKGQEVNKYGRAKIKKTYMSEDEKKEALDEFMNNPNLFNAPAGATDLNISQRYKMNKQITAPDPYDDDEQSVTESSQNNNNNHNNNNSASPQTNFVYVPPSNRKNRKINTNNNNNSSNENNETDANISQKIVKNLARNEKKDPISMIIYDLDHVLVTLPEKMDTYEDSFFDDPDFDPKLEEMDNIKIELLFGGPERVKSLIDHLSKMLKQSEENPNPKCFVFTHRPTYFAILMLDKLNMTQYFSSLGKKGKNNQMQKVLSHVIGSDHPLMKRNDSKQHLVLLELIRHFEKEHDSVLYISHNPNTIDHLKNVRFCHSYHVKTKGMLNDDMTKIESKFLKIKHTSTKNVEKDSNDANVDDNAQNVENVEK